MSERLRRKNRLYRFLEMFLGIIVWTTLIGAVVFSYYLPLWVAIFIILFDLYWLMRAFIHTTHLLSSHSRLKQHAEYDWFVRLQKLFDLESYRRELAEGARAAKSRREKRDLRRELARIEKPYLKNRSLDWTRLYHLVLLPTYGESYELLEQSIESIVNSDYPTEKIFFVLATEERDYRNALKNASKLSARYSDQFYRFVTIMHPDGVQDEIKAKGANITHAAKQACKMIEQAGIEINQVLVSAFDSDTVVSPNYFSYLTYMFLTVEKPYQTSYQPMPVYNNNIWDAPAISRVVAISNSFWQMIEASRPDRLVTFSSHAMTLRALTEVGFWPVDVVSDDSRIFWKCWMHYNGDYQTEPLFTHLSLDSVMDESLLKTLIGQYKQKRRWATGVENFPYLVSGAIKNKKIPLWKRFLYPFRMLEGLYFWATAPIIISVLGWLPLVLGSSRLQDQVIAVNLPVMTQTIMTVATFFLIFSIFINMTLIPPRPKGYSRWKTVGMIAQWIFVPLVASVFGSFPAIEAQTRMMLGRYLGFWVTPKTRVSRMGQAAIVLRSQKQKSNHYLNS